MLHSNKTKMILGLVISILFTYLAFRRVNVHQMVDLFLEANYWYFIAAILVLFFSHFARAIRWGYLVKPIHEVKIFTLFNALIIGYMFNVFLPAHLGEFIRAYVIGQKEPISSSSAFATIVIERILDVFSLLIIMMFALVIFPFPDWVKTSGYITFIFILLLFLLLILMKRNRERWQHWMLNLSKPLPQHWGRKVDESVRSFLDGVVPLKNKSHYLIIFFLSILIWAGYVYVFQLIFYGFDFVQIYSLPWYAALVLLVITTISILVPSSPGYIGTYHYLCQLSLGLFAVPASPALSYALITHSVNIFPVLVLGLIILSYEGLNIKTVRAKMDGEGERNI